MNRANTEKETEFCKTHAPHFSKDKIKWVGEGTNNLCGRQVVQGQL